MKCTYCGAELPEGSTVCSACEARQSNDETSQERIAESMENITAHLVRIEDAQRNSLKMLSSISSSTAILAVAVIIQVILCIILLCR